MAAGVGACMVWVGSAEEIKMLKSEWVQNKRAEMCSRNR